jgi:hypothetical protein
VELTLDELIVSTAKQPQVDVKRYEHLLRLVNKLFQWRNDYTLPGYGEWVPLYDGIASESMDKLCQEIASGRS